MGSNTIADAELRAPHTEPAILAGLLTSPAAEGALGAILPDCQHGANGANGAEPARCPRCGYRLANCGCPGSPRLTGRAAPAPAPAPEPEPVGCPRCRGRDSCRRCGYRPANCTCPGGPREQL